MVSGNLSGTVGPERVNSKKGNVLLIRAGTPHRFEHRDVERQ